MPLFYSQTQRHMINWLSLNAQQKPFYEMWLYACYVVDIKQATTLEKGPLSKR